METLSFKRRKVGNKIFFCTHAVSSDCIVIVSESLFFFSNKQAIDSINNYPFFLLYWYFVSVYSKNSRKNLFWIDLNMINPDNAIMEVLNVAVSRDSYLTVWRSRTSTFFHCSALVIPQPNCVVNSTITKALGAPVIISLDEFCSSASVLWLHSQCLHVLLCVAPPSQRLTQCCRS